MNLTRGYIFLDTNQEILQAIERKDYSFVWKKLKFTGKNVISDIEERYLVFRNALNTFDNNRGCEFYKYYCFMLMSYKSKNEHGKFYLTHNDKIIRKLKNNYISPTSSKDEKSKIFLELKNWGNG